jgi:hypothetical protein
MSRIVKIAEKIDKNKYPFTYALMQFLKEHPNASAEERREFIEQHRNDLVNLGDALIDYYKKQEEMNWKR